MGKNSRHIKNLKSEKAKVKLKTSKKSRQLPKGQNLTNTSFKTKKIILQEQLKQQDASEILSRRKLNVKDLLTRLQHHNSTVRQEAVRELKDILTLHSAEVLKLHLNSLLQGICSLSLDKERDIRRESLKVLNMILSPVSSEKLGPFIDVLISYLNCSMTHINPSIREDSLLFLDVLVQNCNALLAEKSHKILPNFLNMISKLRTEAQPGRQLITNLNSKRTSVNWRIKVLSSLEKILTAVVRSKKRKSLDLTTNVKTVHASDKITYAPIYSNDFQICEIDFEQRGPSEEFNSGDLFDRYVEGLLPLLFDSWLEICPMETKPNSESAISREAATLLKSILDILQTVLELLEFFESEEIALSSSLRIKKNFQDIFVKRIMAGFPYEEKYESNPRFRKRQEDLSEKTENGGSCLEQNLGICHVYIWFTTIQGEKKSRNGIDKEICEKILQFLNDKLENWSNKDATALPQFVRTLKTLLSKASRIWNQNRISLEETLKALINAQSRQSKKEFKTQCFSLLCDFVVDLKLRELHVQEGFKQFVKSLPSLLLKEEIQECAIQTLNTIVLRYRYEDLEDLIKNQDSIIENARVIKILGSEDERNSRLMICNLFYFIDDQIYY